MSEVAITKGIRTSGFESRVRFWGPAHESAVLALGLVGPNLENYPHGCPVGEMYVVGESQPYTTY